MGAVYNFPEGGPYRPDQSQLEYNADIVCAIRQHEPGWNDADIIVADDATWLLTAGVVSSEEPDLMFKGYDMAVLNALCVDEYRLFLRAPGVSGVALSGFYTAHGIGLQGYIHPITPETAFALPGTPLNQSHRNVMVRLIGSLTSQRSTTEDWACCLDHNYPYNTERRRLSVA
jgi:hypothetical protein